jgi:translation initiation factor 2B subunit (eIF-2B alpha/beta/delta family)
MLAVKNTIRTSQYRTAQHAARHYLDVAELYFKGAVTAISVDAMSERIQLLLSVCDSALQDAASSAQSTKDEQQLFVDSLPKGQSMI